MTISSRTPEGQPTSCPLCMANVTVEPSIFVGDATCPRCGHLLWFFQSSEMVMFFDVQLTTSTKERVIDLIANKLGVDRDRIANNPALLNDFGVDSLDLVELVMELEEKFDLP